MVLRTHQCLLAIVFAVLAIPPAGSQSTVDYYPGGYLLGDCRPRWPSTANGTAFRASLAPLLAALPSAAAPTGFASLRSADGRAFARAFCYGGESPSPHDDCRKCLSTALTWIWICKGSGRAGFWNAGCFLAYGDTNASSASEDEKAFWRFDYNGDVANYYPDFYDVQELVDMAQSLAPRAANGSSSDSGRMLATANVSVQANSTVRVLAQCPGNVTAADCARCLEESAQELSECLRVQEHEHDGVQSAGVANVFRYKCYLRLEISAPLAMGKGARLRRKMKDHPAVVAVVAVAIVFVIVGAAFLVLKRIRTSKARHVDS